MDSRNLDKAIEIYARLIQGETIAKASRENSALYEDYYGNAEVYEIVGNLLKKLNLSIYEYNEALYITPGEGNRVFGYTNDDMKRILGLRLNKELFLCYFLMYVILLYFYKDSGSYQFRDAVYDGEKTKASKASKSGYVKLTFNFMVSQKLFVENEERYYPTDRFKALCENYFEEYRGRLYQLLGGEEDAVH